VGGHKRQFKFFHLRILKKCRKSCFILPPATAETKLEMQSAIVRSGRLRSPVIGMATRVVVKMAHELAIPCSLAAFPGDRNFCVTVAIRRPATDLIARQLGTCVSDDNCIRHGSTSSCGSASSAGSSSCYVIRLPSQVVCTVLVITCHQKFLRKTAILVERGETRRFSGLGQLRFRGRDLKYKENTHLPVMSSRVNCLGSLCLGAWSICIRYPYMIIHFYFIRFVRSWQGHRSSITRPITAGP